jgi:ribosomal protein S8E
VQLKKTLKAHDERNVKQKDSSSVPDGALPTFLLDREGQKDAKALSSAIKQKRKDKAAKYAVPLPKVRGIAEDEIFKVMRTGKSKKKSWKRMVTKATFVGEGFTRKPVKMERFVRPMALRYKKANVTHRAYPLSWLYASMFSFIPRSFTQPTSKLPSSFKFWASRKILNPLCTRNSVSSLRGLSSRSMCRNLAWSPLVVKLCLASMHKSRTTPKTTAASMLCYVRCHTISRFMLY